MTWMLNRIVAKIHVLLYIVEILIDIISHCLNYITVSIGINQFYVFIILLFQYIIVKLIHM